jgi:hypothetical protein
MYLFELKSTLLVKDASDNINLLQVNPVAGGEFCLHGGGS